MIVKTRIFELCDGKYRNLSEVAQAMGISVSQVYRVREGKRTINQKFIVGAIKAFPKHRFDDLFYFAPEPPGVTNKFGHPGSLIRPRACQQSKGKQSTRAWGKH